MGYIDEANRELMVEWHTDGGMAKIFTIARNDLDEGSEDPDAWELIKIEENGLRTHNTLIDCAAGRFDGLSEEDKELLGTCPDSYVVRQLLKYIK